MVGAKIDRKGKLCIGFLLPLTLARVKGKIESSYDGVISYTPLESWSGTERFGYTISDGRGA